MAAPGNSALLLTMLAALIACTGYAGGRIHQWYRMGRERDEAFRDGYDTATRSVFSLAARVISPRRADRSAIRASAAVVLPSSAVVSFPAPSGPAQIPLPRTGSAGPVPGGGDPAGRTVPARADDAGQVPGTVVSAAPPGVVDPVRSISRSGPSGLIRPVAPVAPAGRVAPVAPAGRVAPVAPAGPIAPIAPVGPVGPVAPVAPDGSDGSVEPAGSADSAGPFGVAIPLSVAARNAPSAFGPTPASAGRQPSDPGASGGPEAVPDPDSAESSGRHLVPDELVRAATYRLAADRVARAKVHGPGASPGTPAEDGPPRTGVPKPRGS
jgi:hypothetical protein